MSLEPVNQLVFSGGGQTIVKVTDDFKHLLVASQKGLLKIFDADHQENEPTTIDILQDISSFSTCTNTDNIIATSKKGTVGFYSFSNHSLNNILFSSVLPLRDSCLTNGGNLAVVGGDDSELILLDPQGETKLIKKIGLNNEITSLSYNRVSNLVAVSLSSRVVRVYSLSSQSPEFVSSIEGQIPKKLFQDEFDDSLEDEFDELDEEDNFTFKDDKTKNKAKDNNRVSTKPSWRPDGEVIAIPCEDNIIRLFSRSDDFSEGVAFPGKHRLSLVDLSWSPNGNYLASVDLDDRLIIWDTQQKIVTHSYNLPKPVYNVDWISIGDRFDVVLGTFDGHILRFNGVVPRTGTTSVDKATSLFIDAEAGVSDVENNGNVAEAIPDADGDLDDFIIDTETSTTKRPPNGFLDEDDELFGEHSKKRKPPTIVSSSWKITPYSPGATPWSYDKRYLTINSFGYCWSVEQTANYTITVDFFNKDLHRSYHFKDVYGYDLASMNENALVLATSGSNSINPKASSTKRILFRPHDTDISQNWEREVPCQKDEYITCVSVSNSVVVVATSYGYIRSYSLFGVAQTIEKTSPLVACMAHGNYIFSATLHGNSLRFSMQDLDGKYYQRDAALPVNVDGKNDFVFKGLFFSDDGDPCLVGHDDMLLVLSRWRDPLQARWVPILDIAAGIKKAASSGDKIKSWPLGLMGEKFNCIIQRTGIIQSSSYPDFPLRLPTEIEIELPVNSEAYSEEEESLNSEENYVKAKVLGELLNDAIQNADEDEDSLEDSELRLFEYSRLYDKSLLLLLADACSKENSMKAFALANELRDDKALSSAIKIAERSNLETLVQQIAELREERLEQSQSQT
ncbi:Chromatin-associated protein [Komagataella phaffii CBS 7435]|uniref:Chromatin-associated protein n=1 Tax=Komagataella phaffii (strain ATCC 76273 / CBS 7435 / CECT 11047 / NRRL Y-11430 / Wegner 21-1) TaxID=981350 RepID=F2QX44_KOMPC|nr:GQ67_03244T0 [Komagataella phaffii]AOA69065.1 GQ68_03213T0 [Komagataella phaffii GS115]CAH2450028.1 Chromatin-associated protein [Komagataella phaffii CBS 7435]CCA39972.1 Chromatin-associated protein [Komagataella phaffii CBS 7435]